jgi:hypothetical protein
MDYGKGKIGIPGKRASAGIGYLVVPDDISVVNYVANCFRTGTVVLMSESERIDNVRISKHLLNDLEFPEEYGKIGSGIVWVNLPKQNMPVAVGVIVKNNETMILDNHQFSTKKQYKSNTLEISGDAKEALLNIIANSSEGSKIFIKTDNKGSINTQTKEINCEATDINVKSVNSINITIADELLQKTLTVIKYEITKGFSYVDEFQNEFLINSEGKFSFKNKNYDLKTCLDDIITEISNITTTTAIGVQPVLNKVQLIALKDKVSQILK